MSEPKECDCGYTTLEEILKVKYCKCGNLTFKAGPDLCDQCPGKQTTEEEQTLLMIKGAISDLTPEQQAQIQELLEKMQAACADYHDTVCGYAFALLTAAAACEE